MYCSPQFLLCIVSPLLVPPAQVALCARSAFPNVHARPSGTQADRELLRTMGCEVIARDEKGHRCFSDAITPAPSARPGPPGDSGSSCGEGRGLPAVEAPRKHSSSVNDRADGAGSGGKVSGEGAVEQQQMDRPAPAGRGPPADAAASAAPSLSCSIMSEDAAPPAAATRPSAVNGSGSAGQGGPPRSRWKTVFCLHNNLLPCEHSRMKTNFRLI